MQAWAWAYAQDGGSASALLTDDSANVISAGQQGDPNLGTPSLVVVKHRASDGAELWRYTATTEGFANAVASLARAGDGSIVVAAQFTNGSYGPFASAVAKLDAESGQEFWHTEFADVGFFAVAVDPAGDVVAAGRTVGPVPDDPNDQDLIVVKLAVATGTEIWRYVLDGGARVYDSREGEEARVVGVDQSGDVLVAGRIVDQTSVTYPGDPSLTIPDFLTLKLDRADGHLLWRREITSVAFHGGVAISMAVASNGDLIAAGWAVPDGGWFDIVVARFSGTDGTELWRAVLDVGADFASAVALDAAGDVFVSASPASVFSLMKFAGTSGALLWRHDIPNPNPEGCLGGGCAAARAIAIDLNGDALAAGLLAPQTPETMSQQLEDFVVAKLHGADGAEMWSRYVDSNECYGGAYSLVVDRFGDVAVASTASKPVAGACAPPDGSQYAVVKLTGVSGKDYFGDCQDDRDNDGDGLIDYPNDPGCSSSTLGTENPPCQDGIDNDGDGGIDFDGGAAANHGIALGPPDPQCNKPYRKLETPNRCGLGAELSMAGPLLVWLRGRRRRA